MQGWIGTVSIALRAALALLSIGACATGLAAQDFSADIVTRDAAGESVGAAGRLYVSRRKARIEAPQAPAGFFLIDGEAGSALFVQPSRQAFMDAKQSTPLTQIFVPVDPNDPCPQWQAAAKSSGEPGAGGHWHCTRIGAAIADGRTAIEYRVLSPEQPSQRWVDPDLEFPLRLRAADGTTIALEHIQIGAQGAALFVVPNGYRKLDPQALLERIKHSDVWAETPNSPH